MCEPVTHFLCIETLTISFACKYRQMAVNSLIFPPLHKFAIFQHVMIHVQITCTYIHTHNMVKYDYGTHENLPC